MTDERANYLASGTGNAPADEERLNRLREILEEEATWSQPPPDVTDRLLASIAEEAEPAIATIRPRWAPWAAAFAAVALIALVLGLLGVFDTSTQVIAMEGTDLQPAASGQASIEQAGAGWSIRLEVNGLTPTGDGQYYEGWLWNEDGEGISVGTFHLEDSDGAVMLWSGVDPVGYPSLWVTLEREDGDPSASDQIVMRGSSATP